MRRRRLNFLQYDAITTFSKNIVIQLSTNKGDNTYGISLMVTFLIRDNIRVFLDPVFEDPGFYENYVFEGTEVVQNTAREWL